MKKELKYIDELDFILHFLATKQDGKEFQSIGQIMELLKSTDKNFSKERLIKIMNKLSNDEYVEEKQMDSSLGSIVLNIGSTYNITFDGLVLDELGGYHSIYLENNKLKNIQKWQFRLTLYIAIGTIIAGIYYFLEIWKYFTK